MRCSFRWQRGLAAGLQVIVSARFFIDPAHTQEGWGIIRTIANLGNDRPSGNLRLAIADLSNDRPSRNLRLPVTDLSDNGAASRDLRLPVTDLCDNGSAGWDLRLAVADLRDHGAGWSLRLACD